MDLPLLIPVLVEEGPHRLAVLFFDDFDTSLSIMITGTKDDDPFAKAQEIAHRCNTYRGQP